MKKNMIFWLLSCLLFANCQKPDAISEIETLVYYEAQTIRKQRVVFITGFDGDEDGNNYYTNATAHFEAKRIKVVTDIFSLEEIISWLNDNPNGAFYDQIHIVSHSNAWRGMSLKMATSGERITQKSLAKAISQKELPRLDARITENTKFIFHSCGLGKNEGLLKLLKTAFSSEEQPRVYASPYFNVFGGKYASHYLAKPYYVYYPTAQSQGPKALSEEINTTYPEANIDWLEALRSRREQKIGVPYSYRFNIPVHWEVSFEKEEDIPDLSNRELIMDWLVEQDGMSNALYELGIPMEKFRWTANLSGKKVRIKGKTTVISILQPITNENNPYEYAITHLDDAQLYNCL